MNFLELIFRLFTGGFSEFLMYILSVIIPLIVFYLEFKKFNFSEMVNVFLAQVFLKFGNNKLSKIILIKVTTKYKDSYLAHKVLAEIYEKEGGMRKAIDEYVKLIDIKKNDYDSYYKIAVLLSDLQQKEESTIMLNNLLAKKPDYYEASCLLGEIYLETENFKDAVNVYTEALKYRPSDYDIYYNLGIAYTCINDFKNAKMCYDKAAEINSYEYKCGYYLGHISLLYNDIDEAEKFFIKSMNNEDLEASSCFYLAKIYMLKSQNDNAIKYINLAIELDHRIYDKVQEESLFIPIYKYIQKPIIDYNADEKKVKISKKEIKTKKHLERTYEIAGKLSYSNINIIKPKEKQNDQIDRINERN